MPVLSNTRHEAFAQELAKGSSKAAAYEAAGYAPDTSNASKLTANHRVKQRIAEIQQSAIESVQVTVASLVAAADEIRGLAVRDKQYSAAVGAVKEMGVLSGLRIDRREIGDPGEFSRMSDAELMQLIDGSVELIELPEDDFARPRRSGEQGTVGPDRCLATSTALETDKPTDVAPNPPALTLEDHLRPFGLTVAMEDGVIVAKCANGMHCEYSARYFVPVVFPGLEHAAISARLIEPGRGEVRVGGQCYSVTSTVMMSIDLESLPPDAPGADGSGDREADRRAGKQRRGKP